MLAIILLVFVTLVRATDYHDQCELRPWLERCQSEEVDSDLTDNRVHTNDLIRNQEAKLPLSTLATVRPKSRVSQGDYSQMIVLGIIFLFAGNQPGSSLQMVVCTLVFAQI